MNMHQATPNVPKGDIYGKFPSDHHHHEVSHFITKKYINKGRKKNYNKGVEGSDVIISL